MLNMGNRFNRTRGICSYIIWMTLLSSVSYESGSSPLSLWQAPQRLLAPIKSVASFQSLLKSMVALYVVLSSLTT